MPEIKKIQNKENFNPVAHNKERMHSQLMMIANDFRKINRKLKQRIFTIEKVNTDFLQRLINVCNYRDDETSRHNQRVGAISGFLAKKMGFSNEMMHFIGTAAPMHDIGKIAIPDSILFKPGKLTHGEYEIIKPHTVIGSNIFSSPISPEMQYARNIALHHHERWDGNGYPTGLAGENIPQEARIVAVADVFDVLLSQRPYRQPISPEKAVGILRQNKGTQFDPEIAGILIAHYEELLELRNRINSEIPTDIVTV
ncbi:putative two-component system response regulator [Desulfosalsimonas propionicica]|uniref:Putative two-component system response regulator n=1 Tax=Desulfosalsimonas propionicica TaxID=332175 RepID=A0A7W0C990_9BACT|nr:HD-GYP domain-containing protein [Desulfosalsimonas propionicica]MBA2881497.1 putative two-component system response regulator [Desulfosalsimonas propionicica]